MSPLIDLTDMQCCWFLIEESHAYRRQGNIGMALKRVSQIEKVSVFDVYQSVADKGPDLP